MNAEISKEAGLYTQIRTLRKRIDSLDMGKVNPNELKSAIDSLKDLETRYADMQEKKKQRSIDKQNREKELAAIPVVSEEIKPESVPVEAAPEMLAPVEQEPVLTNPAVVAAPVVTAESEPTATEKTADEPKVKPEADVVSLDKVEFKTDIAHSLYMKMLDYLIMADDPQHETIMKFRKAIERVQNEEDKETLKAVFNKEFGGGVKTPWDYYSQAQETPKETEITPEAKTEVKADTSKFALDDVVEPVYGTTGSAGRVMRYDADKDMAYVHWDSGKLATDHGFGAYKGTDLRKRAAQEVTDKVRCNNCYGIYDEDIKVCPKCKTDKYLMQPFMHDAKKASLKKTATSWNVMPNGDLEITLDPQMAKQMDMNPETLDSDNAMYDLFEPVVANGLSWVAPEDIGALTSAPILSDSPGDDQGNPDPKANYWWYPNYQVESPARELMEKGKVIFKKAPSAKTASLKKKAHVVEEDGKWFVYNHDKTKKLSKGYGSKSEAVKRLRQIEYFKHEGSKTAEKVCYDCQTSPKMDCKQCGGKGWIKDKKAASDTDTPETLRKLWDEQAPHFGGGMPHRWQEKDEKGQVRCSYCWRPKSYKPGSQTTPEEIAEIRHVMGLDEQAPAPADADAASPVDPNEALGEGYGGDRPGIAVAPKASLKQAAKINVANREWEIIPKYDLVGDMTKLTGYDIMSDTGERAGFIKTDKPLNQQVIEQEIWNKLNGHGAVEATLKTNLSVLKKGHKVKIVSVDLARKEAKFASLEMKSVSGWTALDKFEFSITAEEKKEPRMGAHCKECGGRVPIAFDKDALCRDCEKKKEHKKMAAELMPLSKTDRVVRIKSYKVLTELAEKCPDCYKKFLKFASEKGLIIRADDLSDHVDSVRTKINQTKEVLQQQTTQAAETAPEHIETEAELPPKPNVTLPSGMKWMYNIDTNTWDMVTDSQFTY